MSDRKKKRKKRVFYKKREIALNNLAKILTKLYGHRHDRREPTCVTCHAWMMFDHMEELTDSYLMDF